jgi:molybdenum cofactor cytidylyltransferase
MTKISAILLAAGLSKRMGDKNKLFLTHKGKKLIDHAKEELEKSQADEIIIVSSELTHDHLMSFQSDRIRIEQNLDYKNGMTSSIQCGIKVTDPESIGYMICLGDQPSIKSETYDQLISKFKTQRDIFENCIIKPKFRGKKGDLIVFSNAYKSRILSHLEPEELNKIVIENKQHLIILDVDDSGILLDIDTEDDFNELK